MLMSRNMVKNHKDHKGIYTKNTERMSSLALCVHFYLVFSVVKSYVA